MAKNLDGWISELRERFEKDDLERQVVKAKITVGLIDAKNGELQYHTLDYAAKKRHQTTKA